MRLGRYFLAGQPLHIIQRGNNRAPIFFTRNDAAQFLAWLKEGAAENGVAIHAYVLMPNHVHLLATPARPESVPKTMQTLGRLYVRYINRRTARTGTLWEGRYRATVIDTEPYLFRCSRYIELNPVRANLASDPAVYLWSSYRANALGASDDLVMPHPLFATLGQNAPERHRAYREMFADGLDDATLSKIRMATQKGWALGDDRFQDRIGTVTGRRSKPVRRRERPNAISDTPDRPFIE